MGTWLTPKHASSPHVAILNLVVLRPKYGVFQKSRSAGTMPLVTLACVVPYKHNSLPRGLGACRIWSLLVKRYERICGDPSEKLFPRIRLSSSLKVIGTATMGYLWLPIIVP